jgi:hypothetical protein
VLLKIVTVFLLAMAVLAMLGRLRLGRRGTGRHDTLPPRPRKCPDCGAYLIGRGPCACRNS